MARRIQSRGFGGTFRRNTLADMGMAHCGRCGAVFTPDYSGLGADADPVAFAARGKQCPNCSGGTPAAERDADDPGRILGMTVLGENGEDGPEGDEGPAGPELP
ncbi:hypothetical protein LAZ40_04560 [Cereibacter sphaeroides]|uniref:hypothetical protein n=1 Tax=Cereibacter sphaeroides TaxID=1063 RepID=UPI001F2C071F|nr:hypothetical protein [Cereibacter sphaeroides]MCE6958328.1 hypothetical protein [Cereibacter sphaeroides]MCE6971154.1 hypothetical protein [Cereibacter sphaeroides]